MIFLSCKSPYVLLCHLLLLLASLLQCHVFMAECISPEEASEQARQCPSVSMCTVAHLSDAIWPNRVLTSLLPIELNAREASKQAFGLPCEWSWLTWLLAHPTNCKRKPIWLLTNNIKSKSLTELEL